jgi:hypothetical protein
MAHHKMILITTALLALSSVASNLSAATINFSAQGSSEFATDGVKFLKASRLKSYKGNGYSSVADSTNSKYVAYNPGAAPKSTFKWTSKGTFDLNSLVIAGAWGTQTLTLSGFNGKSLVGSTEFFATNIASTLTANWLALTHFVIETGNNYSSLRLGGNGQHWALNSIKVNELKAVPIPAAALLFGPVMLGFLTLRRRAK